MKEPFWCLLMPVVFSCLFVSTTSLLVSLLLFWFFTSAFTKEISYSVSGLLKSDSIEIESEDNRVRGGQ